VSKDHQNRKEIIELLERIPLDVVVEECAAYVWRFAKRGGVSQVYRAFTVLKDLIPVMEKTFKMKYEGGAEQLYRVE